MKKNIILIVQVRLTSKRFPNKVIKLLGKFRVLEIILKRLKKTKKINKIVFSIPSNSKNKKLFNYLNTLNVNIFRGSEQNVLDRFYKTAIKYKATDIVRVTADCPLIDPKIIDNLIKLYLKKKVDYLNNAKAPNYSDGFDVEIFSFNALKKTKKYAISLFDKEHVTPFIKRSNFFKKISVSSINNHGIKLSIDTKNDYNKVKSIFNFFNPNIFFFYF